MIKSELKKTIERGETLTVEFKRARGGIPADFWPSYSAFANTEGGVIVLGVHEADGKRVIEGLADPEKICADLWNAANNAEKISANVLFNSSVQTVEVDGKPLVVVDVPRAERTDRPVYVGADVFKGTYRRNGEGDYRCSREVVEGMIRDKCAETADHCVLEELTIADLNADTIRRYRIYFDQLRPGHVWSSLTNEAFLMRIGAAARTRDGAVHPNLAGLVCFGDFNEITNVLPYYFLDYREHDAPNVRWTDRVCSGDPTWSGNIFDFFFRISQSVTAGVKVPFRIAADNVTRIAETDVHKSLREVLANALIHADYHGRRGIVIDKYPKRLEVSNPGTLRIGKSVAIAGGTSDARNGKIFNIFSLVDIGERSGMGLSSLYGVWETQKYADPSIVQEYEPDRTKVVVEFESNLPEIQEKVIKIPKKVTESTTGIHELTAEDTTQKTTRKTAQKTAQKILDAMRENPFVTRLELADLIGITADGVKFAINSLKTAGRIRRVGPDKGGHWEVCEI